MAGKIIEDVAISSVNSPPHERNKRELAEMILTTAETKWLPRRFLLYGDWNDNLDPKAERKDTNITLEILQDRYAARAIAPEEPTRWKGSRIIDYAITDLEQQRVTAPEQIAHAISDHKI